MREPNFTAGAKTAGVLDCLLPVLKASYICGGVSSSCLLLPFCADGSEQMCLGSMQVCCRWHSCCPCIIDAAAPVVAAAHHCEPPGWLEAWHPHMHPGGVQVLSPTYLLLQQLLHQHLGLLPEQRAQQQYTAQ
jgi:hypothetical protein